MSALLGLLAASALAADDYYGRLAEGCRKRESESCCLASVRAMEAGGFKLAEGDEAKGFSCPAGASPDMMKCHDTYRWCAPEEPAPAPRLSKKQAIALAKKALRGKVSYPPKTPIEVEERGGRTVVTFKTVLKPGTPGADYHAQVTLDSRTGKVLKVLGSQD